MKRIYLDYASTTPAAPEVVQAMLPYFSGDYGNPSSIHSFGREARDAVEKARETAASLIGCRAKEIIFTGGGTEGNNTALKGVAFANRERGNHIITSSIEHSSVLETCAFLEKNGFTVTYLPVDRYGLVDPDDVRKAITGKTILVSVMHANNEIGTLQPATEIGRIARERGVCFHTDAVQTFGHIPTNADELNVDLLSVSAHKLYGPKGVGALYVRSGTKIAPFMHGGMQEQGMRASTHNVPGIVGFGRAIEQEKAGMPEDILRMTALQRKLVEGLSARIEGVLLNGHPARRLPGNVHVSFEGAIGELLLHDLDQEGVACSTGSACSAASEGPSHVLLSIGLSHDRVVGSLRFSLGKYVSEEDIDYVLNVLPRIVKEVRALSPGRG